MDRFAGAMLVIINDSDIEVELLREDDTTNVQTLPKMRDLDTSDTDVILFTNAEFAPPKTAPMEASFNLPQEGVDMEEDDF